MTVKATNTPLDEFKGRLYEAALEYLDRGWSIIPISIESKTPLIHWKKNQDARADLAEIESWFERGVPTESGQLVKVFNLGLATGAVSGLVVVDADNAVADAYAEANGLTSPIQVRTARGKHYYWKHPGGGARFSNKQGGHGINWPDVKGLDFRGDGGYVVLPPSVKFNSDGAAIHQYEWLPSYIEFDDLPEWVGTKPNIMEVGDDFSFDKMSLSAVRAESPDAGLPIWDQVAAKVRAHGRRLEVEAGHGTDLWTVKYLGEQVRNGVTDIASLMAMGAAFCDAHFDPPYDRADPAQVTWLRTKVESVLNMDQRNHQDDYVEGERKPVLASPAPAPAPAPTPAPSSPTPVRRRLFTMADVPAYKAAMKEQRFYLDPIIAPGTITQIVGFNGHAKSQNTLAALFAQAAGQKAFGPYLIERPTRTLYLDYENPGSTLVARMEDFGRMFGSPSDRLQIWSPAIEESDELRDMNLRTSQGIKTLETLINLTEPEIVAIDTVRSAWPGMEENRPEHWADVNAVAKQLRNHGCAVVILHHRNKPGDDGLGREAGSTAQLTDVDTQVYVTSVYQKPEDAKRHAGLLDSKLSVTDHSGRDWSPWGYLGQIKDKTDPDSRLFMVQELAFGKVRQFTDNHETHYIGWCEREADGSRFIVSTASKKQKARHLRASGMSIRDIAKTLYVAAPTLKAWCGE
jgi:hypothetical protein